MINRKALGGTDGFRGEATNAYGPGLMNLETVAGLSYALTLRQNGGKGGGLVVVGRDTRPSGPELMSAATSGVLEAGADVLSLGVAPTPAVLRSVNKYGAIAGIVITASHNPYTDNGWKGTIGCDKPYGQEVKDIDDLYWDQVESGLVVPTTNAEVNVHPEIIGEYIEDVAVYIESEFGEMPLQDSIFVTDTANGAAMNVAPKVLRRLGAIVEEFASDGSAPINQGTGATDLSGVQKFLMERPELVRDPRFRGVLANDGDGDRMIGMGVSFDNAGMMVFSELDGNRVTELLSTGQPGVVATEYANNASIERVRASGAGFELCPNGDVEVTRALRRLGWVRGGEFTGHHVDLNWLSSGDGILMSAWVAAYTAKNNTTIDAVNASLPLWPEKMRKLTVKKGMGTIALADEAVMEAISVSTQEVGEGLRFVVRESGTERDAMRIWGVGRNKDMVDARTKQILDAMMPYAA